MSGMRRLFADTRPLAVPEFRRLWSANIITVIGAQLTVVAVPAQIYDLTRSSAYVGLTGIFGLVPLIVLGLYGGALADVMDRRRLLMITTAGLIVTSGIFWLQAFLGMRSVWLLLVVFALQQAFFAVNQPTRSALLPRLVPTEQLPAANALNMTVSQFGAIAGPLIGGALIPVLGYSWLYLCDTITLTATLWAVWTLPPMLPEGVTGRAGVRSVLDGLGYLRGHKVLLMSFVVDIIAMVFGMPRALFPQIAHQSFGGPVEGGLAFALLFAGIPLGAVLGGIFSGWVSRVSRQGLAVVVAIVVWGGAMVLFGLASGAAHGRAGPFLGLALLGLVIGGAADMASAAFRSTMLMEAAGDAVRGRLQGVFIVVVVGGPRIADVAHGGVAAVAGTGPTAAGGGVLVVALVLVAAAVVPTFVRYRVSRGGSGAGPSPRTTS
ncbi:MFS transporter [Nocardioides terrisoli]|uniref:MFS transporter n=1 Tax=Nocardioides terrisoli TaxID=3388267 RepID=UPI00287BBD50|nr:MFS transporter [Nocardioides marmorisolisilvae]